MARNLILTGGVSHAFEDASAALAECLAPVGIASEIETDLVAGIHRWANEPAYGLLTVYALRWRMLEPRFADRRAQWALTLPDAAKSALREGVAAGRPLLALHTATICFDEWTEWRAMIGAAWVWATSFHPPFGPVRARIDGAAHTITRGLPDFTLDDEIYSALAMMPDVTPLAHAETPDGATRSPVLWAREFGRGRVVYDGLGHDRASFEHPVHRRLVARAALWALGRPDSEIETI